jgi:hypothetical protein
VPSGTIKLKRVERVLRADKETEAIFRHRSRLFGTCLLEDEQGRSMDKVPFLADLQPLPPGYTGSIKVTAARAVATMG